MNETTEKCSQARYARTILKVVIFLVKSETVRESEVVPKIGWGFVGVPTCFFKLISLRHDISLRVSDPHFVV